MALGDVVVIGALKGHAVEPPDAQVVAAACDRVVRAETIGVTYGCFAMPARFTPGPRHS